MPAILVAVQDVPEQVQPIVEPPAAARVTLVGLALPEEHMFEEMAVLEPV